MFNMTVTYKSFKLHFLVSWKMSDFNNLLVQSNYSDKSCLWELKLNALLSKIRLHMCLKSTISFKYWFITIWLIMFIAQTCMTRISMTSNKTIIFTEMNIHVYHNIVYCITMSSVTVILSTVCNEWINEHRTSCSDYTHTHRTLIVSRIESTAVDPPFARVSGLFGEGVNASTHIVLLCIHYQWTANHIPYLQRGHQGIK